MMGVKKFTRKMTDEVNVRVRGLVVTHREKSQRRHRLGRMSAAEAKMRRKAFAEQLQVLHTAAEEAKTKEKIETSTKAQIEAILRNLDVTNEEA
jgi:hypothetical protein